MQKQIICIVASGSGVGKTTFLEKLIRELVNRGYRIGTVKRASHGFDMDKKGKDTWRHAQAGASSVAIITDDKFALIQKCDDEKSLTQIAGLLENLDIVLTEGFSRNEYPKIEVVRKEKGSEISCFGKNLIAIVTDHEKLNVPTKVFELNDAVGVADFLEEKYLLKKEDLNDLKHSNCEGKSGMLDVISKEDSEPIAIARGEVIMNKQTLELIDKGDVLSFARVAGIMGVKRTSSLIPMYQSHNLGAINIDFKIDQINNKVDIECRVRKAAKTGMEMEALTGVNIAALTIIDMCKTVDKDMIINNVHLIS